MHNEPPASDVAVREVLADIHSGTTLLESILRDFVEQRARQKRLAQEVAAINQHAEKLNSEMSDALSFQARMD